MAVKEWNMECCGCGACADICPKHAISMKQDKETFLFPVIDKNRCVDCGLCEKTCPISFSHFQDVNNVKSYVGTNKLKDVIYDSSSGGAFTAIYQTYIKLGYVVYGACYDENLRVVHQRAETEDECEKFRKSKYVQSNTIGCFKKVYDDLRSGKKVCFSGVSCQCAALLSYLEASNISKKNLITINILCHGVPSQTMFDNYLEEYRDKPVVYQFRYKNKKNAKERINSRTAYVEFSSGKNDVISLEDDPFLRGYYKRLFYRRSCAVCRFACQERIADFTIADAWGIEKIKPELRPIEGISLILFNTEQSIKVFNAIDSLMCLEEVPVQWALNSQELFNSPTEMHYNRDKFFIYWPELGFKKAVFKCIKPTFRHRVFRFFPKPIKKIVRYGNIFFD